MLLQLRSMHCRIHKLKRYSYFRFPSSSNSSRSTSSLTAQGFKFDASPFSQLSASPISRLGPRSSGVNSLNLLFLGSIELVYGIERSIVRTYKDNTTSGCRRGYNWSSTDLENSTFRFHLDLLHKYFHHRIQHK